MRWRNTRSFNSKCATSLKSFLYIDYTYVDSGIKIFCYILFDTRLPPWSDRKSEMEFKIWHTSQVSCRHHRHCMMKENAFPVSPVFLNNNNCIYTYILPLKSITIVFVVVINARMYFQL